MQLIKNVDTIRLAMLGRVDGNGHPYSWSAIVNGEYDARAMADCGFPVIPEYLGEQPKEALGLPGVKVTHVWCEEPGEGERVAKAACIENVVDAPEDVIGAVDAVVIPTDKGHEHVDRCRAFIEAGVPLLIDKPLVDNEGDLQQFVAWRKGGAHFLSTSAMRYAVEFQALKPRLGEVGQPRFLTITTPKSWERYGIHALEGVYPLLEPGGWQSVVNSGDSHSNIVHVRHACGAEVVLAAIKDMTGAFGHLSVYGTEGVLKAQFADTFTSFKRQLEAFVAYLRTGEEPFSFEETVELMQIVIAGIRSREEGGRRVPLDEISAG